MAFAALAALTVTAAPTFAQTKSSATTGMGGAEQVLRERGNVKGADRIARARCLSGLGACTGKHAGYARGRVTVAHPAPLYAH